MVGRHIAAASGCGLSCIGAPPMMTRRQRQAAAVGVDQEPSWRRERKELEEMGRIMRKWGG